MKMKNIVKYLPVGSFHNYINIGYKKDLEKGKNNNLSGSIARLIVGLKGLSHVLYAEIPAAGLLLGILAYGGISLDMNFRKNPLKTFKELGAYYEQMDKEDSYKRELWNHLFEGKGLADTDGDGLISPIEILEAYNRMGINDDDIKIGAYHFVVPEVSTEGLERAVESYKK